MIGGRQQFFRRWKRDLAHVLGDQRSHRLHSLQHLDAGLGLAGFRGLGLEAIDEGLQAFAFVGLPSGMLGIEQFARGALLLERGIAALVEGKFAAIEMQDLVDRRLEQIAVVTDDDDGARIVGEMVFQPERAFEVEVVCRLVQQQQVGGRKQRRGQRHAHPPATGKFRAWPVLIFGRKSQGRSGWRPHAPAQNGLRCRRAGFGFRRSGLGRSQSRPRAPVPRARDRLSRRLRSAFPGRSVPLARGCQSASAEEWRSCRFRSAGRREWRETALTCRRRCGRRSPPVRRV